MYTYAPINALKLYPDLEEVLRWYGLPESSFKMRPLEEVLSEESNQPTEVQHIFASVGKEVFRYGFQHCFTVEQRKDIAIKEQRSLCKEITHSLIRIYDGSPQCLLDHYHNLQDFSCTPSPFPFLHAGWMRLLVLRTSEWINLQLYHRKVDRACSALKDQDVKRFRVHMGEAHTHFVYLPCIHSF